MRRAILGGRLIDPAGGNDGAFDVLIVDGMIARVEKAGAIAKGEYDESIDAKGLIVAPGFIDLHVHLREPGREDEETVESGAAAAAAGGFTSVCCMPNTTPPIDHQEVVRFVRERAVGAASRVYVVGAITIGREGKELVEMFDMADAGAVAFSDDGAPVRDAGVMRRALQYSGMVGRPLVLHEEDPDLSRGGVATESYITAKLGLAGIPNASEEVMIARDMVLLRHFGGRVHVAHVSTAGAAGMIRGAKSEGLAVTAEVSPHHLCLTDEALDGTYSTLHKMNPPLRTAADRDALRGALRDGTIDAIATDHAPHAYEEWDNEFDVAPFGVVGLETAFGVLHSDVVLAGVVDLPTLIARMTIGPARCLGLPGGTLAVGSPADVTVIDANAKWTVNADEFRSRSRNTPFGGRELTGRVVRTIVGGETTFKL